MRCMYQYKYYVVKSDVNLFEFCKQNKFNFSEVKFLNDIKDYRINLSGQKIKLPSELCCCKNGFFYKIKSGETLIQICEKNKISLDSFLEANPYFNIKNYIAGQIVIIPFNL